MNKTFKYYIQNINSKKYFTGNIGDMSIEGCKGYIWSDDFNEARIFDNRSDADAWVEYDFCFSYAKVRGKHM